MGLAPAGPIVCASERKRGAEEIVIYIKRLLRNRFFRSSRLNCRFLRQDYFPSTMESLMSFSASLRSKLPPSATVMRTS